MKKYMLFIMALCLLHAFTITPLHAENQTDSGIITLPQPQFDRGSLLMKALQMRKSTRAFSTRELPLDVLSNLLWATSGINRTDKKLLTVPSAHNWQEIEVYIAMKQGLYLYNRHTHALDPIHANDIREYVGLQNFTQQAPVNLIFVANYNKMSGNEKEKEFYSATDTGFISQNVYLFCASEGLATVVLGWTDKEKLSEVMHLPKSQNIILTQPVGYPAS